MKIVIITAIVFGIFLYAVIAGAALSKNRDKEDAEQIEYLNNI